MTVRRVEFPLPRVLRPLCKLARLLEEGGEGTLRPPVEAAMDDWESKVDDDLRRRCDSDRVYYQPDYLYVIIIYRTGVSCGLRQQGILALVKSQKRRFHLTL